MKRGITTGTCAAAAANAAAMAALGKPQSQIDITTPNGTPLTIAVFPAASQESEALESTAQTWAVKKYSGDDPDITDGIEIHAAVELDYEKAEEAVSGRGDPIEICGGKGVGRVTLPGLACAVGEAAINPVPKRMVREAVQAAFNACGYKGGAKVTISIPEGEALARKTYNPRLGITGGLSVLGTSGIVEPMSSQALIDTIEVEMNVRKAAGAEYLVITPGNYGEAFLKTTYGQKNLYSVKSSNFIGESLDLAEAKGFKGVLFVGHIGKLVKVAAGIMNTHSACADGRMETLAAHAALNGGSRKLIEEIMNSVTTDSAWEAILKESLEGHDQPQLLESIIMSLMEKIKYHMEARTHHTMIIHGVMFSNKAGLLGVTKGFEEDKQLFFAPETAGEEA